MTTMTDGREVDFGKKTALMNLDHDENGAHLTIAFSDGQYRTYDLTPESFAVFAAYGLRALAKGANLTSSADFDAKSVSWSNPFAHAPRASKGVAPSPLEEALVQVTGKDLAAVRAFLGGLDRKQTSALKNDPRIAPVFAALKAADDAARAARKAAKNGTEAPADLLAGLGE